MSAHAITPMDKVARDNLRTSAVSLGASGTKRGDLEVLSETVSGVALILLEMMDEDLVTQTECCAAQETIRALIGRNVRRAGINIRSKWFGEIDGLSGVWFGALAATVVVIIFMFQAQEIGAAFYPPPAISKDEIVEIVNASVERTRLTEEQVIAIVDVAVRKYGDEQNVWFKAYMERALK